MREYLLDTAPLATNLLERPAAVNLISPWIQNNQAGTSVLCYAEVVEHIKSLPDYPKRQNQLRRLLRVVYPSSPTYAMLERDADIRRRLRPPQGLGLIGDVDTLIAATALERDLI